MTEREYGFWLNNIPKVGHSVRKQLIDYFGSAKEVFDASEVEFRKSRLVTEDKINNILNSKDVYCIKEKIADMESKGYKFVLSSEKNYPKRLKDVYDHPQIIYYRGELPDDNIPSIAIVGARSCSSYGLHYASTIATQLAELGFQIISGLAKGIDTAAHKGALATPKGRTYGVLGCGVNECYPRSNIETFMTMINRGGVLSECPIGAPPVPRNFPARNRIISGLCDGILVVEAKKDSGSLITVDFALEQGKDVYALPGAINSLLSEGCNTIIKYGAKPVTTVEDILEDYNDYLYRRNTVKNATKIGGEFVRDLQKCKIFLDSREKIVYASLRLESKHIEQIMCETGFSLGEVLKALLILEKNKLVIQKGNNVYEGLNLG